MSTCKLYKNKNGKCANNKDGICRRYASKEDNLSLHCSGVWTEEKIKHIKYYAEMFATGMKNIWNNLYYIDLFSGPGKCIIRGGPKEISGACLEAVNLKDKFTKYFLIDKNQACINDLKKRLFQRNDIEYYNDDCNKVIGDIINLIPDNSLSLAFIDPNSLQFNFDSYTKLSKKRIDLIVNFPIGPIERAVSSAIARKTNTKALDKFHPGWEKIISKTGFGNSKNENIKNLINDYIKKIEDLGYYSSRTFLPFKNIKNTTMYFLIFFSKSEKGIKFWETKTKAMMKKDPQRRLLYIV
jgi:three-Cys-motif partner protein